MEMLNIAESFQSSTVYSHGYKNSTENGGESESFSDSIRQEILESETSAQQRPDRAEEHAETVPKEDKDAASNVQEAILWIGQLQGLQFISTNQNFSSETGRKATEGLPQAVVGLEDLSKVQQGLQKGAEITGVQKYSIPNSVLSQNAQNPLKDGSAEQTDSVILTAGKQETASSTMLKGSGRFESNEKEPKTGFSNNVHNFQKQVSAADADQNTVEGRMNQIQEDALSQTVTSQSRPETEFHTGIQQTEPAVQNRRNTLISDVQNLYDTMLKQMAQGKKEFEILLEPANLGKLIIKVSYESGKAAVSILCTNDKTLEMLSQNAKNMGAIMEQRMGTETTVVIEPRHTNPDYLQQQADQGSHSGYERDDQQQNQSREKENEYISFAEQLRLGLM